jgi:hypothetical protein
MFFSLLFSSAQILLFSIRDGTMFMDYVSLPYCRLDFLKEKYRESKQKCVFGFAPDASEIDS